MNELFACTASRAKMTMINSMSKMRGQEKGLGYIQTETVLGESMQKFGRELGEESNFGKSLWPCQNIRTCLLNSRFLGIRKYNVV